MTIIKYFLIYVCCFVMMANSVKAEEGQPFPTRIENNTTLASGTYVVKGTCIVSTTATVSVKPGTTILFEPSAVIKVYGGLDFVGSANNFVRITSQYSDLQGIGFLIFDESKTKIKFEYCQFENLKKPLQFNRNWNRADIQLLNNQFLNLQTGGVFLEIQEIDKIVTDKLVNVKIHGNTFNNNTGSILLAEASWDLLQVTITNNVFTRNEFIGRELNGIFTTPLFLNYNEPIEKGRNPIIKNNSICYNYGSLMLDDTVEFFPTHLTVIGNANFLTINDNYFGDNAVEEFDHFTQQMAAKTRAPLLVYNNLKTKPEADINGHIYKIGVNGARIDNADYDVKINGETLLIELISNRPVTTGPRFKLSYIYLQNDTLRYEALEHKIEFTSGNLKTDITLKDRLLKMRENGYIKVEGLTDENGFIVPTVNIGLKNFLIENRIFVMGYSDFVKVPKLVQSTPRVYYTGTAPISPSNASDTGDILFPNEKFDPEDTFMREKYWDFGVFAGTTMYFGDLAYTNVSLYLPNARPNVGFRLGYNFSEKFRIEIMQNNMVIAGADDRGSILGNKRGTNFERGLSFRTFIYDIGVLWEYRLYRYKKTTSIIPSIFSGVTGYYFNPQAQVNGVYYNLRTVGTEGQKADGNIYAYDRFSVGIPLGIKLTRHIGKHTLISASYTYNKLFTDYLDDVSTGKFQTDNDMKRYNPDLGDVAIKLSNPNGLKPGEMRSASADFDGYSYFGLTFTRKLQFNYNQDK